MTSAYRVQNMSYRQEHIATNYVRHLARNEGVIRYLIPHKT